MYIMYNTINNIMHVYVLLLSLRKLYCSKPVLCYTIFVN